jgi:ppGpp synthetase/RelA/SpoT-type nucleotidyltranferase
MSINSREKELLIKYETEKPMYKAWGNCVVDRITQKLISLKLVPENFFQIPPQSRMKDNDSFIQKALYRKKYDNPYEDTTDKVGVRFIVLLDEDVMKMDLMISEFMEQWSIAQDRNYQNEKEKNPEVFTYQSNHYIVRPLEAIEYQGCTVAANTPCEIQVRTLLQHAYSQVTHEVSYKPVVVINDCDTKRRLARSMALMETTSDLFTMVFQDIKKLEEGVDAMVRTLHDFYSAHVQKVPLNLSFDLITLADIRRNDITETEIISFFGTTKGKWFLKVLDAKKRDKTIYQNSSILYILFLLEMHPDYLKNQWVYYDELLCEIFTDFNVSYERCH